MNILSCKVGETIINTIEYSDEQIRKWSNKGILKCPVCDSKMIYRNGEIKIAHFAHEKDSDCEDIYSEPESEEHLNGKKILYEWLKQQEGVENLKLEAWIPETKQRPDLYFEINKKRYVIEFQCTPIATEYIQRHRLYELAGITDIWVLGINKYNIEISDNYVFHETRLKAIEKYNYCYLDVNKEVFILTKNNVSEKFKPKNFTINSYTKYPIKNIYFDTNTNNMSIDNEVIEELITKDIQITEKLEIEKRNKEEQVEKIYNLVEFLNERYRKVDGINIFSAYTGYSSYYKYSITYENSYESLVFYVNNDHTDCTKEYTYTRPFRGKRGGTGWQRCFGHSKISTIEYNSIDLEIIKNFIIDSIVNYLRQNKYPSYYTKEDKDVKTDN